MHLAFDAAGLATALSLLMSIVQPLVAAAIARGPRANEIAGYVTPALAVVNGLLTEWARTPQHYNWGLAALNALVSYLIAIGAHTKTWKGSGAEVVALNFGNRRNAVTAQRAA